MHILPNTSRSKGNEAMKFDQLIEYNMRNIFVEKSCTKFCGEFIPSPFSKKSILSISLNQQSKVLHSLFIFMLICGLSKYIETKLQTTRFYLTQSYYYIFLKVLWNQSRCLIFCMIFERKYFPCYILLTDQILLSGCLQFVRY